MANIIIVDDHQVVMDSLQYLIEDDGKHKVIGKFTLAADFLNTLQSDNINFEVLILDVKLPDKNGIEVADTILKKHPKIKVILLSQYNNKDFILAGLNVGVHAYLLKSCDGDELLKAIDTTLENSNFFSKEISSIAERSRNVKPVSFDLTKREREVLELIVLGCSNKEIAAKLFIEDDSVEFHKRNLRIKLNANKSVKLAVKAIELGFVNLN